MKYLICIQKPSTTKFICTAITVGRIYKQDTSIGGVPEGDGDYKIFDDNGETRFYLKEFFNVADPFTVREVLYSEGRNDENINDQIRELQGYKSTIVSNKFANLIKFKDD